VAFDRLGPLTPEDAMNLSFSGNTDVGRRRDHNEDAYDLLNDERLFLVADGLGGYAAGEIASQMAIDTVGAFFRELREDEDLTWPSAADDTKSLAENILANAVYLANRRIFQASRENDNYRGMSTTLVGIRFIGNTYTVAHVGDSRCYRVRDGRIEQLTEDHSLLNEFMKSRAMTTEEIKAFPYKNVIMRALGKDPECEVEVASDHAQPGDLYLLCSDGLCGEITDDDILRLALSYDDLDRMTTAMVNEANKNGGRDNVTVVTIRTHKLS